MDVTQVTVSKADGTSELTDDFTVTSSAPGVASWTYLDGNTGPGYITPLAPGTVTLTLRSSLNSAVLTTVTITVTGDGPAVLTGIALNPLTVGGAGGLENGSRISVSQVDTTYSDGSTGSTDQFELASSDPSKITVELMPWGSWELVAVAVGPSDVTVTSTEDSSVSSTVTVNVTPGAASIAYSGPTDLTVGESMTVASSDVTVMMEDGSTAVDPQFFVSVQDMSIAETDYNRTLTGVSEGSTLVEVLYAKNPNVATSFTLNVAAGTPKTIVALNAGSTNLNDLEVTEVRGLNSVEAEFDDGTFGQTNDFEVASADSTIVEAVSTGSSNELVAQSAGTTSLTFSVKSNPTITDTTPATVLSEPVSVAYNGPTQINMGETLYMEPGFMTVTRQDGTTTNVVPTFEIQWADNGSGGSYQVVEYDYFLDALVPVSPGTVTVRAEYNYGDLQRINGPEFTITVT